jgi:hypothetical protein
MPDKDSFKNAIKWLICDKVVIFFAFVGAILLLVTLVVFTEDVELIEYRGIEYSVGRTTCSRLLFKMTTPALAVNILSAGMNVGTVPQYIIQYFLMFAVQIVVYGIVGKITGVMSSGRIVAVSICIGIFLLALALAYDISPAQDSVLDFVRGKPFHLFLMVSNLPALFTGQCLYGVLGNTAFLYIIVFPVMYVVQVLLFGFLGKLIVGMLPGL